jgi:hypothetical protein
MAGQINPTRAASLVERPTSDAPALSSTPARRFPLASIVTAAIDVVLATPDQLPARIAVLEESLKNNPKAAEALAEARATLTPTAWTEKAVVELLSAKMRPMATVTKTQGAAIREYVGKGLDEAELNTLLTELKTTKGPRNIARLIAKYDGNVIGLIVAAITE